MFVKITTSDKRQYVKLVESFRDERGVSRQRVIATLGRLEAVLAGQSNALISGLLRAAGKPTLEQGTGDVAFAPALTIGDTWMPPRCERSLAWTTHCGASCARIGSSMPSGCCA
jgi:hypothetical protein